MSLTDDDTLQQTALAETMGQASTPGAPLREGDVIDGQFTIVRELGRGGMGAVYLAREQQLARDVALKLGNAVSEAALRRVEREAMGLAKLQHPNVVVVHRVGMHDGRLYIAMEHVKSGNARQWAAAKPRTWRELALLYAAAGEGLAAAHAAGLVHRDFKPDNVLVGEDGRPRVADFGLVRAAGESLDPDAAPVRPSLAKLAVMTQTGAIVGTPAYMAPEQFDGDPTDARTDQFALCASLWEALFGTRAYLGSTPEEVVSSMKAGRVERPRASRNVPRRLVAALRRGLSTEPAERWPSLAPLLVELRRQPLQKRHVALIAGAAAVVIAAGVSVAMSRGGAVEDPCRAGEAEIAQTWSPTRGQRVSEKFMRAGLGATWGSVKPTIERYAATWATGRRDACRATRVDGAQSEAILDLRMLCLSRARVAFDTTLAELETSHDALASASKLLDRLPELARCADVSAFAVMTPLPSDPKIRDQIDAAARLVDRADKASVTEWEPDAAGVANQALAAARATAWPPLIAQAMRFHATLASTGAAQTKELRQAAALALAGGDDTTAAWILADGAYALAGSEHPADSEMWLDLARGMWERLGKPPTIGNRLEGADAERLVNLGDPAGAIEATRRANEYGERAYPDNIPDRIGYRFNMARILLKADKPDDAQRELDEAFAFAGHSLGERHPEVASLLELRAEVEEARRDHTAAIADMSKAIEIDEEWFGRNDKRLVLPLADLAQMQALAGDSDGARAHLEQALAIDPKNESCGIALALVEARAGHHARALEVGSALLAQLEANSGADNVEYEPLLITLGISHRELKHFEDSRELLARSVKLATVALGDKAPQTVNAQIELSYTLVALGRAREAKELLEPALAVSDLPPPVAAELHLAFGKALWPLGDHPRSHREGQAGRDTYASLGTDFKAELADADAWLHAH